MESESSHVLLIKCVQRGTTWIYCLLWSNYQSFFQVISGWSLLVILSLAKVFCVYFATYFRSHQDGVCLWSWAWPKVFCVYFSTHFRSYQDGVCLLLRVCLSLYSTSLLRYHSADTLIWYPETINSASGPNRTLAVKKTINSSNLQLCGRLKIELHIYIGRKYEIFKTPHVIHTNMHGINSHTTT